MTNIRTRSMEDPNDPTRLIVEERAPSRAQLRRYNRAWDNQEPFLPEDGFTEEEKEEFEKGEFKVNNDIDKGLPTNADPEVIATRGQYQELIQQGRTVEALNEIRRNDYFKDNETAAFDALREIFEMDTVSQEVKDLVLPCARITENRERFYDLLTFKSFDVSEKATKLDYSEYEKNLKDLKPDNGGG